MLSRPQTVCIAFYQQFGRDLCSLPTNLLFCVRHIDGSFSESWSLSQVWHRLQAEITVLHSSLVTGHPLVITSLNRSWFPEWSFFTCNHSNRCSHFSFSPLIATLPNHVSESTWLFNRYTELFHVWCAGTYPTGKDFCLAIFRISYIFSHCHNGIQFTSQWFCSQKGTHSGHPLNTA